MEDTKAMRTEHGSLTVSTEEDAEVFVDEGEDENVLVAYDVHLVWTDKQLGLWDTDPVVLKQIGGKDGKLDKGEKEFLDALAVRLEEAF